MGNRAVITTTDEQIGLYLHWNGGRDSIEGFLKYCEIKHYRSPSSDTYGWARLCQVIGNFFGGTNSIGIGTLKQVDCENGDNGMYIIKDWNIVGRKYAPDSEQTGFHLFDMIEAINATQPVAEQLSVGDIEKSLGLGDKEYLVDLAPFKVTAKDKKEATDKAEILIAEANEIAIVQITEDKSK